jgi:hypothetical protein
VPVRRADLVPSRQTAAPRCSSRVRPGEALRLDLGEAAPAVVQGIPVKTESGMAGYYSEGPAVPSTWVTGTVLSRVIRCGRSVSSHRDSDRGRVATTMPS